MTIAKEIFLIWRDTQKDPHGREKVLSLEKKKRKEKTVRIFEKKNKSKLLIADKLREKSLNLMSFEWVTKNI